MFKLPKTVIKDKILTSGVTNASSLYTDAINYDAAYPEIVFRKAREIIEKDGNRKFMVNADLGKQIIIGNLSKLHNLRKMQLRTENLECNLY